MQILHQGRFAFLHPTPTMGVSLWPYACFRAWAEVRNVLFTIAVILIVLWALGMVSSYTLGGFLHILLVLAIVVVLIRVIQGRRIA